MLKVSYSHSYFPPFSLVRFPRLSLASTRQRPRVVVGPDPYPRATRMSRGRRRSRRARNDTTTALLISSRNGALSAFSASRKLPPSRMYQIAQLQSRDSSPAGLSLVSLFPPLAPVPPECLVCTLTFLKALSAAG